MSNQLHGQGFRYKIVNCECGEHIHCYDQQNSIYFACTNCGLFFADDGDGTARPIRKFAQYEKVTPIIPIGTQGTIDGKEFTVVAYIKKRDADGDACWGEYLLHNPDLPNYHTLAESDGHWMLVWDKDLAEYTAYDVGSFGQTRYQLKSHRSGRTFTHHLTYRFHIAWAVGEFDWYALEEASYMRVIEYVAPPNIIVSESVYGTTEWYWGRYVEPEDVSKAFSISQKELPTRVGKGVLELPVKDGTMGPLVRFTILMLVLVILTQMLISFAKPAENVLSISYETTRDSTSWSPMSPLVTRQFELKNSGGMEIVVDADLDNDWIELSMALVNDNTGKIYEMTKTLEYYHGYEGGESWSEGNYSESVILSNVPKGKYHFNVYPYSESKRIHRISVGIVHNTVLYSNIALIIAAILLVPVIRAIRNNARKNHAFG
ncbi:MAG: DUF4178 domain-containing protein [Bacteroidota bacterium]